MTAVPYALRNPVSGTPEQDECTSVPSGNVTKPFDPPVHDQAVYVILLTAGPPTSITLPDTLSVSSLAIGVVMGLNPRAPDTVDPPVGWPTYAIAVCCCDGNLITNVFVVSASFVKCVIVPKFELLSYS